MSANKITKFQKGNVIYDLFAPGLDEAVASAVTAQNNAEYAANTASYAAAMTYHMLGLENVPLWNQSDAYAKNDIVRKTVVSGGVSSDHIFRANNDIAAGTAWNDDLWTDTSVWGEIQNMKVGALSVETVRVTGYMFQDGSLIPVPEGEALNVVYNETNHFYSFKAGLCEFSVPRGTEYGIIYSPINGYNTPSAAYYNANMSTRSITATYHYRQSGWFGVKTVTTTVNNTSSVSIEEVPMSEWNQADNDASIGIKFYGPLGHYFLPKNWKDYRTTGVQFSSLNIEFSTTTAANMEALVIDRYFRIGTELTYQKSGGVATCIITKAQADTWYQGNDVTDTDGDLIVSGLSSEDKTAYQAVITARYDYGLSPAVGGHTLGSNNATLTNDWDAFDATQQLVEMWQAFARFNLQSLTACAAVWARGKSLTIGESTYYGNLPTAGMVLSLSGNRSQIQQHLKTIGVDAAYAEAFTIGTSSWGSGSAGSTWSSSQYNATNAWYFTSSGALNSYNKSFSYSAVAVFDL